MNWQDFAAAFCLMMVFEGMMPFLNPSKWRNMVQALSEFSDKQVRMIGLVSMASGVAMLYWVNSYFG